MDHGERLWLGRAAAALLRVRWIVRLPVLLYRVRLGAIFGNRLLMLEHIGRHSGKARYVVLEVVDRPSPTMLVVVSGFGARAQWYRNIRSHSSVRVYMRSHRPLPAVARVMTTDEAQAALSTYARDHPRAWGSLRPVLEETLGTSIDERCPGLPMVALDLR